MSILQHLLPHPCISFVTHDVWNSEILKESTRQASCLNVHESRSKIETVQLVLCSTSTLLLGINCICTYEQWNTHYILLCILVKFIPICCCSVTKSYPTLCDPWTAAHQTPLSLTISPILLKLMSTDLVMLSNHIILCHLLLLLPSIFPSISFPVSQFFASGGQNIGASALASVLAMNSRIDFLENWLVWSPWCSRDSQESSPAPVWKHQFFGSQPSLWSNPQCHTWLLEKP